MNPEKPVDEHSKNQQLFSFIVENDEETLTSNQGVPLSHTDDSLKAGSRGPTLMEDFHFREKMTHFDLKESRRGWSMPGVLAPTAIFRYMNPRLN